MSKRQKTVKVVNKSPAGFVFFVAYIGAAVYFVQLSDGFFGFIWALIKAIIWPGLLTYHGMKAFGI